MKLPTKYPVSYKDVKKNERLDVILSIAKTQKEEKK